MKLVLKWKPIHAQNLNEESIECSTQVVLRGEGRRVSVGVEPSEISLGNVLIGTSVSRNVTIMNLSPCEINYVITCTTEATHADSMAETSFSFFFFTILFLASPIASLLNFFPTSGILPANGRDEITVSFTPQQHNFCTFYLKFEISGNSGNSTKIQMPTCVLQGSGVLPSISIVDVRGEEDFTTEALWRQCKIQEINEELATELTDAEYEVGKYKGIYSGLAALSKLRRFEVNFGSGIAGYKTIFKINSISVIFLQPAQPKFLHTI
jgi:hypothetical protein